MAVSHSERKHAKFAPSSSKSWLTCFGFVSMVAKAPPERPHPSAAEGTKAHECLEFIARQYPIQGMKKVRELALRKWSEVMVFHAMRSWDTICELQPSAQAKLYIEKRVHISKEVHGSLDYAWVEPWGELIIIDYKYGLHLVLPTDPDTKEENSQLMCYGVGMAKAENWEIETAKLAIIQPRAWDEKEKPVVVASTTLPKMRAFEKKVHAAVAEAKKPNPKLVYGEEICRWCRAKSFCPAYEAAQENASNVFDVETKT